MTDKELKKSTHEANIKALIAIYNGYLTNKEAFAIFEGQFKEHNTATKIEVYKKFNEYINSPAQGYDNIKTDDPFIDNAIMFMKQDTEKAKLRIYKLTADAVGGIDDPDFLNDIL